MHDPSAHSKPRIAISACLMGFIAAVSLVKGSTIWQEISSSSVSSCFSILLLSSWIISIILGYSATPVHWLLVSFHSADQ